MCTDEVRGVAQDAAIAGRCDDHGWACSIRRRAASADCPTLGALTFLDGSYTIQRVIP
jgi:hypothetical protein